MAETVTSCTSAAPSAAPAASASWIADSPCAEETDLFAPCDPHPYACLSDASRRLLDACATAFARWFAVVRTCIQRERVHQQLFREEHGLPRSVRLPYARQPLTAAEETAAALAEDLVRALCGDGPADYARDKFFRAIETGDLRAFKIRLLLLKVRDSLKGRAIYRDFLKGLDTCISRAEEQAGCTPDPSPRRLSRREQDRRRSRGEKKVAFNELQAELPLEWPDAKKNDTITGTEEKNPQGVLRDDDERDKRPDKGLSSICRKEAKSHVRQKSGISVKDLGSIEIKTEASVTVTRKVTSTANRRVRKNIHRCREYETIEQILEDIQEGRITPYASTKEICRDVKAGRITDVEAMMFTIALDRYSPDVSDAAMSDADLESELAQIDDGMMDAEDADGEEEDGLGYEESRERTNRTCDFSYNPNGFCGCWDGHYSDGGATWNTDDEN